jgi:tetratricopeptide (TPR) repeat protein
MTTAKRLGTLCLLLGILLALSGCARPEGARLVRSEQISLSPEARASFNYLKHLELKRAGKPDKALRSLQNATRLAPSPQLYIEQGRHYWSQGRPDMAREAIKSGLQQFPGQGDLVRYLARLFIQQDKLDNATSLLNVYLRKHGGDPATVAELAQINLREERYAKARELLQSVPEKRRTARIHYLLGRTFLQEKQPGRAVPHLRSAVEANPDYLQAWAQLGYARESNGDYARAKQAYAVLLDKGRKNDELLLKLVDLDLKLNNPDQAMAYVEQDPSGPDFLIRAASLFLRSEFYSRAEVILDMLPQSAREGGQSLYYRGVIALRRDQAPQKALDYLQRIPGDSKMHQDSLLLQGRILYRNDQLEQALKATGAGQQEYPENASFWSLESRILMQQDKPRQARDILRQGLKKVSPPSDLWSRLAVVEHELGNHEEAMRQMQKLLEKEPENAAALNFIGYTLVEQDRDLDKAGRMIRRALKLDPGNPYYLDSLAWYQFKTTDAQKAWKTIREALAQVGDDPVIWEHYGDIARALNKRKEARKGYEKALGLDPDNPGALREKLESVSQ